MTQRTRDIADSARPQEQAEDALKKRADKPEEKPTTPKTHEAKVIEEKDKMSEAVGLKRKRR